MKGYKVFQPNWTCRGFKYEVGKTYEEDVKPECCKRGFHFCTDLIDCFTYYVFNPRNKVAEVKALGEISTNPDDSKCCTNKIKIVRELTWYEVLNIVNTGKDNIGMRNIGDNNIGNSNIGDKNSGFCNTGHRNAGSWNIGSRNTGFRNTGSENVGNDNIGDENTGFYNIGDENSGHHNQGDFNTGDWNLTDSSTGCFNTKTQTIYLFDKPSDWTINDWARSTAYGIMGDCPSDFLFWVDYDDMTKEEIKNNPNSKYIKGYMKQIKATKHRQIWWDELSDSERKEVMSLPNFDKDIFKQITGIDVDHKKEVENGKVSED